MITPLVEISRNYSPDLAPVRDILDEVNFVLAMFEQTSNK